MIPRPRPDDPRKTEIIKHLKILAKRHGKRLVVTDYLNYRAKSAPQLPALTTLYRLFGSWPEALAAAGVDQAEKNGLSRTSDKKLEEDMLTVAKALGTDTLSTHAYDEYRGQHPDLKLSSSSAIRKWKKDWASAVASVGLKAPSRATPRRLGTQEIIEGLRRAKKQVNGMLTPHAYTSLIAELPDDQREEWPSTHTILSHFPNWEAALRAADVEQSDALHPQALWTAEEARHLAQTIEALTKTPLEQKTYEQIYKRRKRPMPTWKVLQELLSDELD